MYDLAKSLVRHPTRWIKLLASSRARRGKADVSRWADLGNFDTGWDERSRKIAARVPAGASVIEFGCGRGALRAALAAGTDYVGSDIVARGPETLVWDLNDGAPPLDRQFDVAIFSGVLEYVADLPALLAGLAPVARTVITSYASLEEVPNILTRRESGWVNDLKQAQFVALFPAGGYRPTWRESWIDSTVYQFDRDA